MCGIAGILRISSGAVAPPLEAIPEAWLDILDDGIKHRGPDGNGRFRDRASRLGNVVDVALVHRRLSIIDPADGHQPMVLRSGREQEKSAELAVVFNGCIYNHRDLRQQLQKFGHRFATDHSDTEVLLHGWKQWGLGEISYGDLSEVRRDGLCSRLDGMFAFALWDSRSARLTLCRDQHGEKPLYHVLLRGTEGSLLFAFSSTPAPLARLWKHCFPHLPGVRIVDDWLKDGYAVELPPIKECRPCETLTAGMKFEHVAVSAAPNHNGENQPAISESEFEPCGSVTNHPDRAGPTWRRDQALTVDNLDRLLDQAVRSRLESDVPLGCFLSGGVDSSLVAFYAKRALGTLKTFTVKMPEDSYDESSFAEQAARFIGTDHTTLECNASPAEDLVRLITQLGMPFGDSSLLPTFWVSRAARAHVSVALSGDGGDELFAGYDRYRAAGILARYRILLTLIPAALIASPDPKSLATRLSRLVEAANGDGYRDLRAIFSRAQCAELGARNLMPPDMRPQFTFARTAIEEAIASDCREYLPGDILRKTDTASMSVALEVRSPFLSNAVTAAARSATIDCLMPKGERKGLLRALARRHLPANIVDRPKQGFAIPVGDWFRNDYGGMKTLLLDTLNSVDPFPTSRIGTQINRVVVNRLVEEHMSAKRDHSQRLYMLLVLGIWAKL